ncbi:MAG: type II toxin-antitoxin system RelE family toxin [Thermoguttaceae bacterium]|jgi:mRNA interferase RelE/StbE
MAEKPRLYEIKHTGAAARDLKKLVGDRSVLESIDRTITALKTNPRPNGYKKLSNNTTYRVRDGNYRILYEIDEESKVILITRVQDRKEVYKHR